MIVMLMIMRVKMIGVILKMLKRMLMLMLLKTKKMVVVVVVWKVAPLSPFLAQVSGTL